MTTASPSLVEELLADQQSLTAVEQFSRAHDERARAPGARYRNLIPLEAPRPGEQYAFEVELDKCSGCKACVTACHSLNGLDENETWREVGLLINEPKRRRDRNGEASFASPTLIDQSGTRGTRPSNVAQHVTTACHHCVDPACLNGCPVLAYEKDPVTGIVRHLDDQCIGCQYCVLKCPYDVPKYNDRLGIVRKCDMCSTRLVVGEAPACVQACPNEAIRITKVEMEPVRIEFRERGKDFLTGAPDGRYTLPTTRYIGSTEAMGRGISTARRSESASRIEFSEASPRRAEDSALYLIAADARELKPQPAHWPLVAMLVLSQASVGIASVAAFNSGSKLLWLALVLGAASMAASTLHLGRPLGAWRFFLGLKRSWLSREILAFSTYIPFLVGALVLPLKIPAVLVGLIAVFCSMMIYHDTRRVLWRWPRSTALFFGTMLLLGLAGAIALNPSNELLLTALVSVTLVKLGVEIAGLRHVADREFTSLKKTAMLITSRFQWIAFVRMLCALTGGIGLPILLNIGAVSAFPNSVAWLPFAILLVGEMLERLLFFRAVDAPKMPGGLPT